MNNILDDDSIERRAKEVASKKERIELIQSDNVAYLLKNINHIKNLIKGGEIDNNAESVQESIRAITNSKVKIELNKEVISILKKNRIYTKQRLKLKEENIAFFIIFGVIFAICMFITSMMEIFGNYEIDYVNTFILCVVISAVLSMVAISD